MAEPNHQVAIWVAIIGMAGALGAALFANWDKVFIRQNLVPISDKPHQTTKPDITPPPEPPEDKPVVPDIAGVWRDSGYDIISEVSKSKDSRNFGFTRSGTLPNGGKFSSSGVISLAGNRVKSTYNAKYQTGEFSSGKCDGSVSSDVTRIELSCSDTLLGSFKSIVNRE
jgi:hypothetical protein